MSFLLDSDTCSAYLRDHPLVANRFVQYGGRLHVSTVTLAELLVWAKRKKAPASRMQTVLKLQRNVDVLSVDEVIAEKFGDIRAALLDAGLHAPQLDMLNAAVAWYTASRW